jgi:hypothetical protein
VSHDFQTQNKSELFQINEFEQIDPPRSKVIKISDKYTFTQDCKERLYSVQNEILGDSEDLLTLNSARDYYKLEDSVNNTKEDLES